MILKNLIRRTLATGLFLLIASGSLGATLSFRSTLSWPSSTKFQNLPLGGLSACIFDPKSAQLLALSDDQAEKGPVRFYEFKLQWPAQGDVRIETVGLQPLLNEKNKAFRRGDLDPEGITLSKDGYILIAHEGNGQRSPRLPPGVIEYTRDGHYIRNLPLPAHGLPTPDGPPTHGTRHNAGFEGLTLTPSETLWASWELPLLQDDGEPDLTHGAVTRLLSWKRDKKGEWLMDRELAVDLETVPNPEHLENVRGFNSVSEILAVSDRELLWMERSNLVRDGVYLRTLVRIYSVDIHAGPGSALDVLQMEKLDLKTLHKAKKHLLFDFDSIKAAQPLDNLEGLCWGPPLPGGKRSLIAVSDNNFNPKQRTQWVFLEYAP